MDLHVPDTVTWDRLTDEARHAAPEAFAADHTRNLLGGRWTSAGSTPEPVTTPVDGSALLRLPMLDPAAAQAAVTAAAGAHRTWSRVPLADRTAAVRTAVDAMTDHRDLLAHLLMWEIGKPWRLAAADVDRALSGVRWYLDHIEEMTAGRRPLPGPVSNIASWNYPMSVLVHAELVQLLAGNAVVAKTPTQGGGTCLTVAHALMAGAGLPVTLLSGRGGQLSQVLVRDESLGAVAFVGGRDVGGRIAAQLVDTSKRHMLEMEGVNAWGVWEFSGWASLAGHLRKSFEYGKQRCTAYPRFVVQRKLVDSFLACYLPVVSAIRTGHPLAVADGGDPLPELDYGPLISAAKVVELRERVAEALAGGAVPLYRGDLDAELFVPGQDTSAYAAPVTLLAPPGSARLAHAEPFGPVDSIVVVDTEAELLAAMNASNGALVASLACDDEQLAGRLAADVRAFKVGINRPRSRGDRDEPFGGVGASWKGAFVGGELLVRATTIGPADEELPGNFPTYSRYPAA
jgi:acyl-CoA reductase-like NAD-dependent aldehyde dehydrogenase